MKAVRKKHLWWQEGIIYQIYPRSFQDSDGDGVGDLRGIINRLPYLKSLGVQALWIAPVFSSPMADFGYDISDHTAIHPLFGTMADLEELLLQVHRLGMKLILDLVANHTSEQHPWFLESRSSRHNPRRDWYLWADAREDGSPPNNWLSTFGGSAWEWDPHTGQYYYHSFLKAQPDLNWRNPAVQEAMLQVMRFWLLKGVDGFRINVLWHLVKDALLRDNPENPDYQPRQVSYERLLPLHTVDQPEVHDIVRRMRMLANVHHERLLIGEVYLPVERLVTYYGADHKGVHLPFNFQLLTLPWQAEQIGRAIADYEALLPAHGWPNWVLGNHDQVRLASRLGEAQARVAAMLLLTLRGTPIIYYGEEIGMRDVPIPAEQVQDPQGLQRPELHLSRDPARSPMQWDDSPQAGFTQGVPWLPVSDDYLRVNVGLQESRRLSILNLYKRLIALRQQEPALKAGSYRGVYSSSQLLAYLREEEQQRFLVVLNLTHRPAYFLPQDFAFSGKIEISTFPESEGKQVSNRLHLYGDEGVVIRLT